MSLTINKFSHFIAFNYDFTTADTYIIMKTDKADNNVLTRGVNELPVFYSATYLLSYTQS